MLLSSTLTCPKCGGVSIETMPTDACQFFYDCKHCGSVLRPLKGDCCVFCSYGDVPALQFRTGGRQGRQLRAAARLERGYCANPAPVCFSRVIAGKQTGRMRPTPVTNIHEAAHQGGDDVLGRSVSARCMFGDRTAENAGAAGAGPLTSIRPVSAVRFP